MCSPTVSTMRASRINLGWLGLTVVSLLAGVSTAQTVVPPSQTALITYLEEMSAYIAELNLPSNSLSNQTRHFTRDGGTDHIFVNGNLARVVLATYRLQAKFGNGGNETLLNVGLGWCDTLVSLQAPIEAAGQEPAGYWGVGYPVPSNCSLPLRGWCAHAGSIYFGDTGTAVTTLALCHNMSKDARQRELYVDAMSRFGQFVLGGSTAAPVEKKGVVAGFVDPNGAVGCGYYACSSRTSEDCEKIPGPSGYNCPSRSPYTIATGTTGGAFFGELFGITQSERHGQVATNSIDYLKSVTLDSGEIPYILDGANCSTAECSGILPSVGGPWPYDTMSYATEGIAAVALRFPDRRESLIRQWKPSVDFLLRTQNSDGYWGKLGGSDLMRSPRCLTLLSWWLSAVETKSYHDIPTRDAVSRYLNYVTTRGSGAYGIMSNTITTGMAGLAIADAVAFGVTYSSASFNPPQ
eukprot:m.18560 g.18560  ORF g.18560 m.18560 type:complete len:465 (+) comp5331_c0_seq2:97-1491(+)